MKKYFLNFVILLFSLNSFAQKNDTTIVVLLHTNDMHGYIDKYAQIKPIVDSIRQVNKNTLFISVGDLFSGNPIVDKYPEKGYPMIDMMNRMEYDISCLGNHEFDYGQVVLKKRIDEANFPFICANIYTDKSILDEFAAYKFFNFEKTKIAIVSVIQITKDGYPETLVSNLENLGFSEPIAELKQYKFLKDSANIVVAITHVGYQQDKIIRKKIKYLDLIIGGHSHTFIEPHTTKTKTPIFQVGSYNNNLGEIILYIVENKIVRIENKIYNISDNLKANKEINAIIKKYNNNTELNKIIANLPISFDKNKLAELMAKAYSDTLKTELAVMNYGGIRVDSLAKGKFTKKQMYELDPFNNELYSADLTIAEIKSLIKSAYKGNGKLKFRIIGFENLSFTFNSKKVKEIYLKDKKGNDISEEKTYSIVISSYVATKYNFVGKEKLKPSGVFSNDAILNYLRKMYPNN